jgi:branched-chain amino acid transport system substrate-binding protein
MLDGANALPTDRALVAHEEAVMRTRSLCFAVALAVAAGLAAPALAQSPASIKIGVIQPLSGPVAASGNYVRMGAEIARDWINARGGVGGRRLELAIEDNKSDPKEAATAAEKLIVRDKVPAIMGAWGSSMTLAAMPKLEEYGVPMVVETSSAASITKRGNPWIFRISPPSEMEALGLEPYVDKLGVKRADFLAVNTDWGRGAVTAFGDMLKKKGAAVGTAEFMDQAATDMSAQLTKIKGAGGDTLFLTTSVEQITLVLKQAQEQRLARKIVTTGGSSSPSQLVKQAGAAAEGSYHVLFFLPWFPESMPDGKLAKAFVDEWTKRGHPFEGLTEGFRGHDGIATIAEAVRLAGKDDPKAIRDALWKVSITGVNGPIKFDRDGPAGKESGQSKPSIFVVQIRDGKVALPDFVKN